MVRWILVALFIFLGEGGLAQAPVARPSFDAFEVATVKPVDADAKAGRMFKMDGTHRWVGLKLEKTRGTVSAMVVDGAEKPSVD
jgi:hypothetical protein